MFPSSFETGVRFSVTNSAETILDDVSELKRHLPQDLVEVVAMESRMGPEGTVHIMHDAPHESILASLACLISHDWHKELQSILRFLNRVS